MKNRIVGVCDCSFVIDKRTSPIAMKNDYALGL